MSLYYLGKHEPGNCVFKENDFFQPLLVASVNF